LSLNKAKYFLLFSAIFELIALIILILFKKAEISIFINENNSVFFDYFFKYFTFLGTGLTLVIAGIIFLFKNKKAFFTLIFTVLFLLILVNATKKVVDAPRPKKYFEKVLKNDTYQIHYVEGEKIHSSNSFPSGHSATAFAVFMLISVFLFEKKYVLQIISFFAAALVGYSRMYLFQHFLIDVFAGFISGFLAVFFSYIITFNLLKFNNDSPILKTKKYENN
jgi:membrane-associated phospholipid phosphatase